MINKKYEFYIFSFLVTLFMSFVISGVLVFVNLGFINDFLLIWLSSWGKAWLVAFPSVLLIIPFVRKLMVRIIIQD